MVRYFLVKLSGFDLRQMGNRSFDGDHRTQGIGRRNLQLEVLLRSTLGLVFPDCNEDGPLPKLRYAELRRASVPKYRAANSISRSLTSTRSSVLARFSTSPSRPALSFRYGFVFRG